MKEFQIKKGEKKKKRKKKKENQAREKRDPWRETITPSLGDKCT